jgi:hypothetical protein
MPSIFEQHLDVEKLRVLIAKQTEDRSDYIVEQTLPAGAHGDASLVTSIEMVAISRQIYMSAGAPPPNLWGLCKREFRSFLCSNNKAYAPLRKKFERHSSKSQLVIATTIAAAIAPSIGIVVAGVLVPFCTLCMYAVAKVGKEVFCKSWNLEIPIDLAPPAPKVAKTKKKPVRSNKRK